MVERTGATRLRRRSGSTRRPGLVALVPLLFVAGCSAGPTADGEHLATELMTTIERQIDVRPTVRCAAGELSVADGAEHDCTVTDAGETHTARVRVVNPDGDDDYSVRLEISTDDARDR
ncbi:DUF4333 domain-containing protein [Isoptericola halotolerans]|uniref:DUF4333 domain-containing protein n=1 Tax=Isoptericola halotolerans TaxID=300560 RepID=UPI00388D4809